MAAGNFTLLNIAKKKILDGSTIDLDGHTFKLALTLTAQSIDATFAGSSTDARYADLTQEAANGAGYTTGGTALTSVTLTRSTGTITFDAADVTFTSLTKTFKYGVVYDDTATNKDILGFVDFDTTPGSVTVSGSNFVVQWNASGLFTAA